MNKLYYQLAGSERAMEKILMNFSDRAKTVHLYQLANEFGAHDYMSVDFHDEAACTAEFIIDLEQAMAISKIKFVSCSEQTLVKAGVLDGKAN